jgi:hypothetical protein
MERKIDRSLDGESGLSEGEGEFRFVWEEVTGPPEQRAAAGEKLPRLLPL